MPRPSDFAHATDPLDFLGLKQPPVYWCSVRRLRELALVTNYAGRPLAKVPNVEGLNGCKLVRDPSLRLVPESEDMAAHLAGACAQPMVQPEFDVKPPVDLVAAVCQCVAFGCGATARSRSGGHLGLLPCGRLRPACADTGVLYCFYDEWLGGCHRVAC